jgi:hypothetical protein
MINYLTHSSSRPSSLSLSLKHCGARGFALIATISIMALLVMIALGMLSLSTVEVRSSQNGRAMAEAQSNARMALMLAIGKLQQHAGSDMRITAPADILDSSYPPALGVWRSWGGSDHEASGDLKGRPKAPDYSSKTKPLSDDGRFVSWLVSGADESSLPGDVSTLVQTTPSASTVPLLAAGTLAESDTRQVHVIPQNVDSGGAIAWWISGENQKARIPKPYDESNSTAAEWADRNRSHAVADPEPFGLDPVLADPSLADKAVTRSTADFIANGAADAITPTESFHDLSSHSMGLLTNVATGGWRKDLSLLTEKWDEQPTSGLEFFNTSPTENLEFTRPANAADYNPDHSLLYHWADYRRTAADSGYHREPSRATSVWERGSVASWEYLQNYATLYRGKDETRGGADVMTSSDSRAPDIISRTWRAGGGYLDPERARQYFHQVRLAPQVARIQLILSHFATEEGAAPGKYRPAVLQTPLVTLWNPYNVRITMPKLLHGSFGYQAPVAMRHQLGVASDSDGYFSFANSRDRDLKSFYVGGFGWGVGATFADADGSVGVPIVLEPGETRVFSPEADARKEVTFNRSSAMRMRPGVRLGGGTFYALDRRLEPDISHPATTPEDKEKVSLPGGTEMNVDVKFDVASTWGGGENYCGISFQWLVGGTHGGGNSNGWWMSFYKQSDAENLFPPVTGLASATLAQCVDTPVPFLSMTLGSRISNYKATATKGVLQANPVVDTYSNVRFSEPHQGDGNSTNSPWDYSYHAFSSGPADDMLPNVDNQTNSSYIITGVRKAEGVPRIVCAEIPTRPLTSLADLTHMQLRLMNQTPPHTANIVANSDATPLIPRDSVVDFSGNWRANSRVNEQQDDSYCANHLLFDDWFFSSIAPKPSGFGQAGGVDLRQNYLNFLTSQEPLANRSYLPIQVDQVTNATKAGEIYTHEVEPSDSWKTIASRLEVQGMFNVNSTSVKAWRALLGHARNQKIPYTEADGSIALSEDTDYAFSRISVAGDRKAGEPAENGGYFGITEFGGYRVFTDDQLDSLAEKIVEQIRLRGPFLSLSEFVNRQLSDDTNLALGGAIQTALNELTADSSLNPFETMQNESQPSLANPPGQHDYVFPEAAVGHNTYGLPGWTRQADILRPLAPILSARDDTFTIRTYGDVRDANGNIIAHAWCEATVRRERDFVNPADEADLTTPPTSPANQTFGRGFKVITFRWLNQNEV